jgi:hypothetical protein
MDYQDPELYVYLVLNDLTEGGVGLESARYNEMIGKALDNLYAYAKKNLRSEKYRVEYLGEPNRIKVSTTPNLRRPFMAFHQTFGLGILGHTIVPNFQTELALIPHRSSIIGYTLGWRSMYWTSSGDSSNTWRTHRNGVLQAGITLYNLTSPEISKTNTTSPIWGVYLGRVVQHDGTFFEQNTWNLSMTIASKGFVKVQPEVYFDGFFKRNVRPGIRIQMGF